MWKEATAVAAEAAKRLPQGPQQVQLMYAGQLADTGQLEQGIALAKAQLSPHPAARRPRGLSRLAQIYIRAKQCKDASDSHR